MFDPLLFMRCVDHFDYFSVNIYIISDFSLLIVDVVTSPVVARDPP